MYSRNIWASASSIFAAIICDGVGHHGIVLRSAASCAVMPHSAWMASRRLPYAFSQVSQPGFPAYRSTCLRYSSHVAAGYTKRVRRGLIDPETCGVSFAGIKGAWFVAGNVVRDLAALNKREMLQWDYWGIARGFRPGAPVSAAATERVDAVAALTAERAPNWKTLRETYEHDDRLRVSSVILSFPKTGPKEVVVDWAISPILPRDRHGSG